MKSQNWGRADWSRVSTVEKPSKIWTRNVLMGMRDWCGHGWLKISVWVEKWRWKIKTEEGGGSDIDKGKYNSGRFYFVFKWSGFSLFKCCWAGWREAKWVGMKFSIVKRWLQRQCECRRRKSPKMAIMRPSFYCFSSLTLNCFIYNRNWQTFSVKD